MKIGLICSHGGHLTEMLQLQEAFAGNALFFASYHSQRVDDLARCYPTYTMANIGMNIRRLLLSFLPAWRILRAEKPALLVSTGSEIAIPFFVLAKLLRIRTIFVESCCRIHSPSRTGKLLYPLVDTFLVQWPELLEVYGPKARYEGGLL